MRWTERRSPLLNKCFSGPSLVKVNSNALHRKITKSAKRKVKEILNPVSDKPKTKESFFIEKAFRNFNAQRTDIKRFAKGIINQVNTSPLPKDVKKQMIASLINHSNDAIRLKEKEILKGG